MQLQYIFGIRFVLFSCQTNDLLTTCENQSYPYFLMLFMSPHLLLFYLFLLFRNKKLSLVVSGLHACVSSLSRWQCANAELLLSPQRVSFYPQQTLSLTSWIITAVKLPSSVWPLWGSFILPDGLCRWCHWEGSKCCFTGTPGWLVEPDSGSAGCGSRLVVLNIGQKVMKELNQSSLSVVYLSSSSKKAASFHFTFIWCNFRC